jgi:hypothetical protein
MFRAIDLVNAPLIAFPLSEIVWPDDGISRCHAGALMSAKFERGEKCGPVMLEGYVD